MKYIKIFEDFEDKNILIIVDIQKSFSKFFTKNYLKEVNNYCETFKSVYQIWDNHSDGRDKDKNYLYDSNPDGSDNDDIYHFPNQKEVIEKRYNYNVDAKFYKKILEADVYDEIRRKEKKGDLKRGDYFPTKGDTILVYIGNSHVWHHLSKKLMSIFKELKGKEVTMIGGADNECYLDIEISARSLGVKVKRNFEYIYSASNCPIK